MTKKAAVVVPKKKVVKIDKKKARDLEVKKRKVAQLRQKADTYRAKVREITNLVKTMNSPALLKKKGPTLRKASPKSEAIVEETS